MTNETVQGALDRILAELKSDDATRQLIAIHELETIKYSSEAILARLEWLAVHGKGEVQKPALDALSLQTSQFAASKSSALTKTTRQIILAEIAEWQEDGLIETGRAEVLKRHYDFDIRRGIPIKAAVQQKDQMTGVQPVEMGIPAAASQPANAPAQDVPAVPAAPRPGLMQSLLSEFSIRIYLYLGAFFVIVAAAILAALVEAARLPILLIATLGFAAGAVLFKKRLPQPSFAFAIVFSFLLPIDAVVTADSMNLNPQWLDWFWSGVYVIMAVFWAIGTWMYASRLFSFASFAAIILGIYRFDLALDASYEWILFSLGMACFIGLIGSLALLRWRDRHFALPVFLLAQGLQGFILAGASIAVIINLFETPEPNQWIALTMVCLIAAAFYAASDLIFPFLFFPWMAAASLFPVPWLLLSALDADTPIVIAGFWFWGALIGLMSEAAWRIKHAVVNKYHYPLLALSLPLFFVSIVLAFTENNYLASGTLLGTGVLYTVLHAMRPRGYVWSIALIAGLGAYFSFFVLPFMEGTFVYFGFQLLIASLLLLIPELFFKGSLNLQRPWNWPPVALGVLITGFNLLFVLTDFSGYPATAEKSIIFGGYALLFAAYAWRFTQPMIGYLAAASAAVSAVFTLNHFDLDLWLPALTAVSVIYFGIGYLIARKETGKAWGAVLVNSGLALGAIISVIAVLTLKPAGGWYALVIAALFAVEMFTRRIGWLELFVGSLISIALIILMNDYNVRDVAYYLFGLSLVWLAGDTILHFAFKERTVQPITWLAWGALTFASVGAILLTGIASAPTAICFGVYAVFFAAHALLVNKPWLGYLSTAGASEAVFYALDHFEIKIVLAVFTALAVVYYAAGYLLRTAGRANGWDSVMLFSGLGLGTITALSAPFQTGGIEKSIPIAMAATLFAVEAYSRRNIWLAFPANALYLISYFTLLGELDVDEPQYFSIGAALLGMVMHFLLMRAKSKTGAFIMGMLSQLTLLGTTYIQMVSTERLGFFFVIFGQSLAVLVYGILMRSRSLVIAPIAFAVLATVTVLYTALRDLSIVVIVGVTGIVLLALGILAVLMRERITTLAERFSDWNA
jgi:hypothetical protein